MHTIHTYRDYGVGSIYGYMPDIYIYPATRLRDVLKHVRDAMEEGYERIGVFDDRGECCGVWLDESEPELNGEGEMQLKNPRYSLMRLNKDNAEAFSRVVNVLYKR